MIQFDIFSIPAGEANFTNLAISTAGDHQFNVACQITETTVDIDPIMSGDSGFPLVVVDWPVIELVRKNTMGLRYTGPSELVANTLDAFNELMVEGSQVSVDPVPCDSQEATVIDTDTLTKFRENQAAHPYCIAGKTC